MMKFIRGLRILLTNTWYNYSFLLAMISTGIISVWLLTIGSLTPNLTDPVQGLAISIVVSFQYFLMTLVILSLIPRTRNMFFEGPRKLQYQILLSIVFVAIFMLLGGLSAIAGPYVGAALAFGDALVTAFFTVLLGWNVGRGIMERLDGKTKIKWILFFVFLVVDIMIFGAGYMYLGLATLPFEQQIVMLLFPLCAVILPIMTIMLREDNKGPEQTSILTLFLFGMGLYYTVRLVSIADPQWTLVDILIQSVLLIYGLSSTTVKVHEDTTLRPMTAITVLLLVILARVGAQVNRLLAAAVGFGNIVQIGIVSFTIMNLAILGLLVPVYWMYRYKKGTMTQVA